MDGPFLIATLVVFLFGVTVGSFLNVCILRLPKGESIVSVPSHCMSCGKRLKPWELIPLFSWIFLGGKCSGCKAKISAQYPVIEAANGFLWIAALHRFGIAWPALTGALMLSCLLVLSVIDARTREIPNGCQLFILALGVIATVTDLANWADHVIGFFAVSVFLLLLYLLTRGRGIGAGDVKLMAVCGLVIGWKLIVIGFFAGCILGSIIHLTLMAVKKAGRVLAMGPYLSLGVFLALLFGERFLNWYLSLLI